MKSRMKRFFLFEVLSFMLIVFQLAIYVFMWRQILVDSSLRTMDFVHFYGAGRLIREGDFSDIYDIDASRRVQRIVVGDEAYEPLLFNHPPHVAPILGLIADDDYISAYIYWSIVRILVWIACTELIRRYLVARGWDIRSAYLGALGNSLFFPVFISFLGGQDTIFALFGLLVWMFALLQSQSKTAGLGLAFATLTPTITGILAVPFIISHNRAGRWFIAGMVMLGVYSLLLVGGKGLLKFIELLQISAEGAYYGFEWDEMYNLLGLTLRFSSQISVEQARVTAWFFVLFVIGLLSYLWWHFPHSLSLIGISVVLATFVSPHLYLHSLGFLMLPLIAGMIILRQQGYEGLSILLPPIVSVLFILALLIVPDLSYLLGYVIMATLLVGLSILQHRASQA